MEVLDAQPNESAPSVDPFEHIRQVRASGDVPSFLGAIHHLASTRVVENPAIAARIKEEGRDPTIRDGVIQLIARNDRQGDTEGVLSSVADARLIGLGELPKANEVLTRYEAKHSTLLAFYTMPSFQDNPENRKNHTYVPREILKAILKDTKDLLPTVSASHRDRKAGRVAKDLKRVLGKTGISRHEREAVSSQLVTLFQDENLRAEYPQIAKYVDRVRTFRYKPPADINGTLDAFLYSLRILADTDDGKSKITRRALLSKTAAGVIAIGAAAAASQVKSPAAITSEFTNGSTSGLPTNTTAEKPPESTPGTPESGSVELFQELLKPLVEEAKRRRRERAEKDPEYWHKVDRELNEDRLNIILFGHGDTHEPPNAKRVVIGSSTIVSINTKTNTMDFVTLNHDIRAPEIERFQQRQGFRTDPMKIDQAFRTGRFDLMRLTLEDSTGLSCDFQVSFKDRVVQLAVDELWGGVDVDVPIDFETEPFWLDDELIPKGTFPKGKQKMNGQQALQFIKAENANYSDEDRRIIRNVRKHIVMESLFKSIRGKGPGFLKDAVPFLNRESKETKRIEYDFDIGELLFKNLQSARLTPRLLTESVNVPDVRDKLFVVNAGLGDGGVEEAVSSHNPAIKEEYERGVYTDKSINVPLDGNPNAPDLVSNYWQTIRRMVKSRLHGS